MYFSNFLKILYIRGIDTGYIYSIYPSIVRHTLESRCLSYMWEQTLSGSVERLVRVRVGSRDHSVEKIRATSGTNHPPSRALRDRWCAADLIFCVVFYLTFVAEQFCPIYDETTKFEAVSTIVSNFIKMHRKERTSPFCSRIVHIFSAYTTEANTRMTGSLWSEQGGHECMSFETSTSRLCTIIIAQLKLQEANTKVGTYA
jgi:hypothetical protein